MSDKINEKPRTRKLFIKINLRKVPKSLHAEIKKYRDTVMIGHNTIEDATLNLVRNALAQHKNQTNSES
jgi:hypothetical protein